MIVVLLLIVSGLLIAFSPHFLSIIVAAILILVGVITTIIAYDFRRKGAHGSTEVIRYIIRH